MDALSYLASGVFTANMTGNTVVLGLALIGPERSRLFPCAVSLGAFAVGALIAAAVLVREGPGRDAARDIRAGMALELPFAIAFALLAWFSPHAPPYWMAFVLIASAASALGVQSVAVRRLKIAGVVTTFITGTITTAIVSLVERRESGAAAPQADPHSPLLLAAMFVVYVLAAAATASLRPEHLHLAASTPVVLLVVVLLRAMLRP